MSFFFLSTPPLVKWWPGQLLPAPTSLLSCLLNYCQHFHLSMMSSRCYPILFLSRVSKGPNVGTVDGQSSWWGQPKPCDRKQRGAGVSLQMQRKTQGWSSRKHKETSKIQGEFCRVRKNELSYKRECEHLKKLRDRLIQGLIVLLIHRQNICNNEEGHSPLLLLP